MKRKLLTVVGILLAVSLIVGFTVLAVANYGSQEDPLVALSYLNTTVTPSVSAQLKKDIDTAMTDAEADIDKKIDEVESELSDALTAATGDGESFTVLSLSGGQTLKCSVGTEIMLRIGTAVSAGPDLPRLVDETAGTSVDSAGTALIKNHMYMVTIKDNGIKAASNAKILIRGTYTVS